MKLKNPVWLNSDRTKAVPAEHEDAAFLLAGRGAEVSDADVKKYSLTELGAQGQKSTEATVPQQYQHMVTDATPDGVNTAPDSPQAVEGLIRVTTPGNETKNQSGVTITRQADKKAVEPESAPTTGKKRG